MGGRNRWERAGIGGREGQVGESRDRWEGGTGGKEQG